MNHPGNIAVLLTVLLCWAVPAYLETESMNSSINTFATLDRHSLAHKPDLAFLDFTINDAPSAGTPRVPVADMLDQHRSLYLALFHLCRAIGCESASPGFRAAMPGLVRNPGT